MNNCLLKNPPIVHIVDVGENILHTMVFVGNVPRMVEDALKSINKSASSGKISNILREYFGNDYRNLLNIRNVSGGDSDAVGDYNDAVGDYNDAVGGNMLNLEDIIDITDEELAISSPAINDTNDTNDTANDTNNNTKTHHKPMPKVSAEDDYVDIPKFRNDGQTTYIFDIQIFPEDKISEIRDKIYLATSIPMYRQHLYWHSNSRVVVPYKLYAERIYNVDIVSEFKNMQSNNNVAGMPVDKFLYVLRDELRVETIEPFTLVGDLHNNSTFYIVDLNMVLAKTKAQLYTLDNDTYLFDLFYYGFIIRFWPQMTPEVFRTYLTNPADIPSKYPELCRNLSWYRRMINIEQEIINDNYNLATRINSIISDKNKSSHGIRIYPTITSMIATTSEKMTGAVNIRNIFDKFVISRCYPEVHAYVTHENTHYLLKKKHSKNQSDINFPSMFNTGITIAISLHKRDQETFHSRNTVSTLENEQSRYLFLNITESGKYFIKSLWNEEDGHDFDSLFKIMKKFTDPIISLINSLGKYVFVTGTSLPFLTKANITYKSLNICVFWKKLVTEQMFKAIRAYWQQYSIAEIISTRGIQQSNVYEFTFRKGVVDFDTTIIERVLSVTNMESIRNHYAKMSNSILKQKWTQLYDGRVVKMSHRTTDIKFEVTNIKEREFHIFYEYLLRLVINVSNDKSIKYIATNAPVQDNKLTKLREADPELFNLKKYGSKKVYSIICQNPRQPVIYTEDEINSMKKSDVAQLESFYNFTLNKPAYYGCPTDKYPHLSFIVGVHPKGYCIPCCGKSVAAPKSKKNQVNEVCRTNFEYVEKDKIHAKKTFKTKIRHIVSYGKEINIGRISRLPDNSIQSLFTETETNKYFIFGVEQHFPNASNVGILYSLSKALNITPVIIINKMLAGIAQQKQLFASLINGSLIDTFQDLNSFIEHMGDVFVRQKELTFSERTKFKKYNELFMELAMYVFGIYIIIFNDPDGTGTITNILISDALRWELLSNGDQSHRKYLLIMNRNVPSAMPPVDDYFPIFAINTEVFFKQKILERTLFVQTDEIIVDIHSILHTINPPAQIFNIQTVKRFIADHPSYSIVKKYANKRNLIYALILENKEGKSESPHYIYLSCDYSSNTNDGILTLFDIFIPSQYKLNLSQLEKFMDAVDKWDPSLNIQPIKYVYTGLDNVNNLNNVKVPTPIGLMNNSLLFYINNIDKPLKKLPIEKLGFDPIEVNNAIMKNLPPADDVRKQLVNAGLYRNNIYNLLVMEFINYMEKEKNTSIRNAITKLINETNFRKSMLEFSSSLNKLLQEFPIDVDLIMEQVQNYYYKHFDKKELIREISASVYEFDRITLNKLRSLPRKSLIDELKKIIRNFSVEKDLDLTDLKFPNVYLPCEWKTSEGYCSGKKLIIQSNSEYSVSDYLVELLADDITNPLISKYMFDGLFADNIINFFNFEQRSMQTISIWVVS